MIVIDRLHWAEIFGQFFPNTTLRGHWNPGYPEASVCGRPWEAGWFTLEPDGAEVLLFGAVTSLEGREVVITTIHPDDAYSDRPHLFVGMIGVLYATVVHPGGLYSGEFVAGDGCKYYFSKVAVEEVP